MGIKQEFSRENGGPNQPVHGSRTEFIGVINESACYRDSLPQSLLLLQGEPRRHKLIDHPKIGPQMRGNALNQNLGAPGSQR
jgi:hypothetical protein